MARYESEVKYNGKTYLIDHTTRVPQVSEVEYKDESGVFAEVWAEATGKRIQKRVLYQVPDDEAANVILACGWKFRKSQAWQREWDYRYTKAGRQQSRWGKQMVKVMR